MKTATLRQSAKVTQMIIDKETPDDHLQWMLESGALSDLLDANPEGFDRDAHRKFHGLKPLNPPLLIAVGAVSVAATTTPFVARSHFIRNMATGAPVKISYLGENFTSWFLGKEEQPFGGSTLRYGKLSCSSVDDSIITELGGVEKAETTLTELFGLLQAQKNGESGPLLTNGRANVFYIKDANGVLRSVGARWYGGGWRVNANSVTRPDAWLVGLQVFSRNS